MNCICKKKGCKKCNPEKAKSVKAKTTTTQIVRRRKGGTGGEYDKKVLIVVDVQNCFLNEGSYGINNGQRVITILTEQLLIVKNVIEKIKEDNGYDLIVFSRDAHTDDHISYTVHPIHCRKEMRTYLGGSKTIRQLIDEIRKDSNLKPADLLNLKRELVNFMYSNRIVGTQELDKYIDDRLETIINGNEKIGDVFIIGSDLSYLFILCDDIQLREFFYKAYNDMKFKFSKAGLRIKYDDEIQDKLIKESIFFHYKNKQLVVMDKGEYDNAESYSSFNYHYLKKPELAKLSNEQINTKMDKKGITQENVPAREQYVYDELPRELKYSTGLTEIIKHGLPANTRMLLDVCGFVTEICVKQTGVNGYYYLNFINNNNNLKVDVNIDYSLSSTLLGTSFNVYEKQIADIQSELMPKIRAIESIKSKSLRTKMSQMSAPQRAMSAMSAPQRAMSAMSAPQRAMSAMSAGRKQMRPKK
jgi:nicotinamidase-related amidase